MKIISVGPDHRELVESFVLALLNELGDEARDLGALNPDVLNQWEQHAERMRVLVAFRDDDCSEPIGMLTLTDGFAIYANGSYGIIPEMYVVPAARGERVGAALLERAAPIGRELGWSRIEVTAPESQRWERTVRFYEENGFSYSGPKLKLFL